MSKNAGFTLLEPDFQYAYQENIWNETPPEDSEAHRKQQNVGFKTVLKHAELQFQKFITDAKDSDIPIAHFNLTREIARNEIQTASEIARHSLSKSVHLLIDGERGKTEIFLQLKEPLSLAKSETLLELFKDIQFENLNKFEDSPKMQPAQEKDFADGLILAEHFERFSLGLTVNAFIRTKNLTQIQTEVQAYLQKIGPFMSDGFKNLVSRNLFWAESATLVSLRQKVGPRFETVAYEKDPAKSVFNPYGPLFDDFGRRSAAQLGILTVSMLFMAKTQWNDNSPLGNQRARFENWLRLVVRDQDLLQREVDADFRLGFETESFQTAVDTGAPAAARDQAIKNADNARKRVSQLISIPQLRNIVGQTLIDRLVTLALDYRQATGSAQTCALMALQETDGSERKKVFMQIIKDKRHGGRMAVLSQFASYIYDADVIETLFQIQNDASTSEDDKLRTKDGLQTIRNQAESAGKKDLVLKIEQGLGK